MSTELTSTGGGPNKRARNVRVLRPVVDILESDSEYLLVAELPGVRPDEVTLDVHEGRLRLEAKLNETARFEREFLIPDSVDDEKVKARVEAGLLHLHLPKNITAPRRIPVHAG